MITPVGVSLEFFVRVREAWIKENAVTDGAVQRCRTCHNKIEIVGAFVSIHDARFNGACVGSGAVIRLVVPYCPRCETRPPDLGCVHEYPGADPAAAVRN